MSDDENTAHVCEGPDCPHDDHKTDTPAVVETTDDASKTEEAAPAEGASCKACAGEEGEEHTCGA